MTLLCFLPRFWDTYSHRPHIEGLSEYCRVICFDPPYTPASLLFHPAQVLRFLRAPNRPWELHPNLAIFPTIAAVPYRVAQRLSWLKKLNRLIMKWWIARVLPGQDPSKTILMVFRPQQDFLLQVMDYRVSCYEVHDNYLTYPRTSPRKRRSLEKSEQFVVRNVDVVFVFAKALFEKCRSLNPNTVYTRNAADPTLFLRARQRSLPLPSEMAELHQPIIGYVGRFNELMDLDLMEFLAKVKPSWSYVLLGEVNGGRAWTKRFRRFLEQKNVYFLGWKKYEDTPQYMKFFDVGISPLRLFDHTISVSPQKVFQYLAMGLPVVSTNLPEIMFLQDVIEVAVTSEDFLKALEKVLGDNDSRIVEKRLAAAQRHSVQERAKERLAIIRQLMKTTERCAESVE